MNPLEVSEIILVVGLWMRFDRKSAGMFKSFRRVCKVWMIVGDYLFPTPHIDLANKASVLLDNIKFESSKSECAKNIICRECLLGDNQMIKLIKSYKLGANKCLTGGKIKTIKLLSSCIQINSFVSKYPSNPYISFSSEATDITLSIDYYTNRYNYNIDIDSMVSNDTICKEINEEGYTISQYIDKYMSSNHAVSDSCVTLSKYLSNDCVYWFISQYKTNLDLSWLLQNKSYEEMRTFIIFVFDIQLLLQASKCKKFKDCIGYKNDDQGIITLNFENKVWVLSINQRFVRAIVHYWESISQKK